MDMWYFTPLEWVRQGQKDKVLDLAEQYGMEAFYAQKYLSVLQAGAAVEEQELFDKSHGFYLAVVQGFFLTYYYTRGSAFSFLIEEKPVYRRYTTPWCGVTPPRVSQSGGKRHCGKLLCRRLSCSSAGCAAAGGFGARSPRCVRIWNGNGAETSCQCW